MTFSKLTLPTAALIAATSIANAGGLVDPIMVMEPDEIIAASPSSSSAGLIIPLILIALITVALSKSGGGAGPLTDLSPV